MSDTGFRFELPAEALDALAEAIAEKLAKKLATPQAARSDGLGLAGRITLAKLVQQLPPAKKPQTWKAWLYERLRRDEVPGAVKLGGDWFFDVEQVRAWLEKGAP